LGDEEKKPEVRTDAYFEFRIKELQTQLKTANDTIEAQNKDLELIRLNDAQRLLEEIVGLTTFTVDDLKDKGREELLIIRAAIDKTTALRKGIQPGSAADAKPQSGLTAGKWDSAKKEWIV
jgi:hypothetical protein